MHLERVIDCLVFERGDDALRTYDCLVFLARGSTSSIIFVRRMPNQATRKRRQALNLPTNVKILKCDNETLLVSRLGPKQCTTRFVVVGNSPQVTMCWIGALFGCETGFRLFPHEEYTVWVFKSIHEANSGIDRFKARNTIELPWYVPNWMRKHPMYVMDLVSSTDEYLTLI